MPRDEPRTAVCTGRADALKGHTAAASEDYLVSSAILRRRIELGSVQ